MVDGLIHGFSFAVGAVTGGVFVLFAVIGFVYLCEWVTGLFK